MKTSEIKSLCGADSISTAKLMSGKIQYTVRRTFFYSGGKSADDFADQVRKAFGTRAAVNGCGEIRKPFRGGATVANSTHWWASFTLEPESAPAVEQGPPMIGG